MAVDGAVAAGPTRKDQRLADGVVRGEDHTEAFKNLVQSDAKEGANRRRWLQQRDESLGPIVSLKHLSTVKDKQRSNQTVSKKEQDGLRLRKADEEWIGEAKKVHRSIVAVVDFLQSIRRPYLSTQSGTGRRPGSSGKSQDDALQNWKGVTSLTDKERDEIEFQVKVMIKRCLGRIKELEKGEEVRKQTTPSLSANPFSRLLGSASTSSFASRSHPLYAEQLTQHRAAIIQYLSKELTAANGSLGNMQEARLRSEQRRRVNLAGSAATTTRGGNGTNGGPSSIVAGSVSRSSKNGQNATHVPFDDSIGDRVLQDDFSASDLSPQQVQQFEQESSALIKSLSEDLSAIEAAERKLSEISDMQTQLIQHLGSQAEAADHLKQEGIGHTLEVGRGNEQLQKAKDNNRQASRFLCMFLVGSGLGLLFLHWMD